MKSCRQIRIAVLLILLAALLFPVWYAVNWYSAGLVDQSKLIEFGMEEDFFYCHQWRPERFNEAGIIVVKERSPVPVILPCIRFDRKLILADIKAEPGTLEYKLEKILKTPPDPEPVHPTDYNWCSKRVPIMFYAQDNNDLIFKYLVENGADINQKYDSMNLLHYAVLYNNIEQVELLIKHGMDVNNDDNGMSYNSLSMACFFGSYDVIPILLKHGVNPNVVNHDSQTSLNYLMNVGEYEMIKLLRQHGAKTAKELKAEQASK